MNTAPVIRTKKHITFAVRVGTDPRRRFGVAKSAKEGGARLGPLIRIIEVIKRLRAAGELGCDLNELCRAVVCSPKTIGRDIRALELCGFVIGRSQNRYRRNEPMRYILRSDPLR